MTGKGEKKEIENNENVTNVKDVKKEVNNYKKENNNKKENYNKKENNNKKKYEINENITKILGIKMENKKLIVNIERKTMKGIKREAISANKMRKLNPWILLDFYESKINFY